MVLPEDTIERKRACESSRSHERAAETMAIWAHRQADPGQWWASRLSPGSSLCQWAKKGGIWGTWFYLHS